MDAAQVGLDLLNRISTKSKKKCIETLIKIFRNISFHPDDPKYRIIRLDNKRFQDEVWQYEGCNMIMLSAGWQVVGDSLHFTPEVPEARVLQMLIDNRDVKPSEKEWTESNKVIGLSSARIREEKLREKALKEKAKEMELLKKDMAERKALAKRIVSEHRHDMLKRRVDKPSIARPLGSGGSSRMTDIIAVENTQQ